MPLYQEFADVYDTIFTEKESTTSFLTHHLKKSKILDLACGTGTYAIELAKNGFDVVGTDLDHAMIAKAKSKKNQDNNPVFRVENMLALTVQKTYDGIYSIGNSIVHLEDEGTIKILFKKVYNALKNPGVFIIQIINYARILDQHITSLPTIENEGITFERYYQHTHPTINFDTVLTIHDTTIRNSVTLYPIRPETVVSLLNDVGFNETETYGDFNGAPFNASSSVPFIVVAKKRV
jgi:2-polyprenyl-3-methyl-5-hydroxy-6-metoxy-1,4-benzoquinol methylase